MVRIVSRVVAMLAIMAALIGGIYYALVTTVSEIRIEGADECAVDKFSLDDYYLVVTSKAGTEKSYPLSTLAEELPDATVKIPDDFSVDEDDDFKPFRLFVTYKGLTCKFNLSLTKGNFDDVSILVDGTEVESGSTVNVTYSGNGYGVELQNVPEGTTVTAMDKDGNVLENYADAFVDAGVYNVIFKFERESYVEATKTVTIVVNKKVITPKLSENIFEFDGNPAEILENFSFKDGGKTINYAAENYDFDLYKVNSDGSLVSVDAAIEIGNYRLIVMDKDESNYTFKVYQADITIYKEYRVTFRQKGAPDVVVTVKHGETVKNIPTPKNVKGYKCDGWNWGDRKATDPVTSDFVIEANMEVINYNITFVVNGAEIYIDMDAWAAAEKPETYTVENASNILIPTPKMADAEDGVTYYFDGWYLNNVAITVIPEGTIGDIVLYAKAYEIYTYNYFVDNNKDVEDDEVEHTISGRQPTIYNIPHEDKTANGYKFTGWSVIDASGKMVAAKASFPYNVNEEGLTFVANYELIEYKIYFRGNKQNYMPSHPTVAIPYITYTVVDEVDVTSYVAEYAYCDFNGWYSQAGAKIETIAKGTTGDVELYAKWTAQDVNIAYVSEGGENLNNFPQNTTVKYYSTLTIPAAPSRYGYDFMFWSLTNNEEVENNVAIGETINVNADAVVTDADGVHTLTIYAIWSEQIFGFHYSDRDDGLSVYFAEEVKTGTEITLVNFANLGFSVKRYDPETGLYEYNLPHDGKLFAGWKVLGDESGTIYLPGEEFAIGDNTTFVPAWIYVEYNITFDYNTTDPTLAGNLPVWGEGVETRYTYKLPLPASTLTRKHYTLVGWSEDKDAKPGDVGVYKENPTSDRYYYEIPKKDTVLYAVWDENVYTITFDFNNKAGTTQTAKYDYGTVIDISKLTYRPTNIGYTLNGWFTETGYTALSTYKVEGDATLKCKWTALTNTLVFNTGYDNKVTITQGMYKSDSTVILPECTHDRMFYKFIGWKDSVTKEVYQPGEEYTMPAMNANSTRTLEAQWAAIEYTIEFNIPGFAEPVTKKFTYENMTNGVDGKQYNLTYAMMQLNEGAFIFNGWFDEGVEISAVSGAVLSELYANKKTVYSIDVNIEAVTGYDFERVGSGYAIVSYYGVNDAKLPTHYNGLTVTEISYGAFDSCAITSVTFASKNNITEIGYNAFNGCVNLKSIVIPEEVIKIDRYAFRGCDSEFKIYLEATEVPVGFANYWNADGKGGSYNVYVSEEE